MSNETVTTWARTGAQGLWDALARARAEQTPRTLAHVEDALFRHYLPMARAMARAHSPDNPDPEAAGQAAEVGLAHAILGWRHRDSAGFDRFARATITAQLRRHDRLTRNPQSRTSSPGPSPPGTPPPAPSQS